MSRKYLFLIIAVAGVLVGGCGDDEDDDGGPTGLVGGVTVYGLISDEQGNEAGPVTAFVVVGHNGLPVVDAEVTINGVPIPFSGTVSPEEIENPFYESNAISLEPGTEYELVVNTAYGSRTFTATMPDEPIITAPAENAVLPGGEPVVLSWLPCENAEQFVGTLFLTEHRTTELSVTFSPAEADVPPGMQYLSVTALNGVGEHVTMLGFLSFRADGFWAAKTAGVSFQTN